MNTAVPCYYHLDVEVSSERVSQVRRILAAHLRYWKLDILVDPVCRGVEVLLHTIDEHATDKNTDVEMWWNGQHLITAVSDHERDLPGPHYAPEGCLAEIAALSDGWGGCPTPTGKIIWFSRRARLGERAPLLPVGPAPTINEALEMPREVPVPAFAGSAVTDPLVAAAPAARAHGPELTVPRRLVRPTPAM
ncbi:MULTISPECIES: pep a2 [unclassified Streptomyces]|uniref:pep a2 n=1 Tax=unclassified Streptomyces TaxID=2593676 RepID=UPI00225841F9|nr:pep a2 [Streptomyces sp. NBC_00063]MCX5442131.1 pep a2 [Streptomyces sp. NBC_00063]MCX5442769.1 pep a2 [Streptomyces sp. NBC_00063]